MLERIFCLVVFAVGVIGMTISSSILKNGFKNVRKDMFIYYTNLSNLAVVLYHVVLFLSSFYPESDIYVFMTTSVVRLSVTLMILMTFVIYNFILWPASYKNKLMRSMHAKTIEEQQQNTSIERKTIGDGISNICVHYLVPLITLVEWFCVAEKSNLKVRDGAVWVICPIIYIVYIMIRAKILDVVKPNIENLKKYPYFFIDVDEIGAMRATVNIVVIGVVSILFGMTFVFLTTL